MGSRQNVHTERGGERKVRAATAQRGYTAPGGVLKVNSVLSYVGVDIGAAHRTGERASRWHIVEVFGVLQIVGGAELFVFGQSEEADILAIRRLVVLAQFG